MNEESAYKARDVWFEEFISSTITFWERKIASYDPENPATLGPLERARGYLDAYKVIRTNYFGRALDTYV